MCQWCLLGDELLRLSPWIQESLPLTCHKLFVSGLDGSGFAPCFSFHMIECVSVHEYANACYFLSHTIWKCQFWWWKSLISPRQANENSGQWDFSVIALRNSEKCLLQSNTKSWSKHSVNVTVWKLWMSVFPSNNFGWKWATTHELRNDGKESDKRDFQVVARSSFCWLLLQQSEKTVQWHCFLKRGQRQRPLRWSHWCTVRCFEAWICTTSSDSQASGAMKKSGPYLRALNL